MILYPAIDIRGGKAVRLLQGDYARETTYDADPVDAALRWAGEGAEFLHVVDLDGAKAGEPRNLDAVSRIAEAVECPIQVGGGLRDPGSVGAVLGAGAARVVIGTAALRDPGFLDAMLAEHGDRVVVSVDARDGKVALAGWTESSDVDVAAAVAELAGRGVARFLCTAIEVDGTMEGPALEELGRIAAASPAQLIASGGVGELSHLEALAREAAPNVEGAIVGRALYERRFTVAEGIVAMRRSEPKDHAESIAEALDHMHPELARLRNMTSDPVYLVGGAVRDLLLGRGRADIDLVVVGDATVLAAALGAEVTAHERFGTAKVSLDGHELDIATARSERYPHPGALPVVDPAAAIEDDLRRRDFTVNAMAIPLHGEPHLIDPHGGQTDLAGKLLRILHAASFEDDPTRAIRAARYAARFGFELEPETARLIRDADLGSVSADRRQAELLRLAAEPTAPRGFGLLAEWGLVELREGGAELVARVDDLIGDEAWRDLAPRDRALLTAALGPPGGETGLAGLRPGRPSEAVAAADGHDPVELVLARALGADWLDRYVGEWRHVELEIGGEDLIAAGVRQGPALGRGLKEALRRKLDGEVGGREEELAAALAAAKGDDAVA